MLFIFCVSIVLCVVVSFITHKPANLTFTDDEYLLLDQINEKYYNGKYAYANKEITVPECIPALNQQEQELLDKICDHYHESINDSTLSIAQLDYMIYDKLADKIWE